MLRKLLKQWLKQKSLNQLFRAQTNFSNWAMGSRKCLPTMPKIRRWLFLLLVMVATVGVSNHKTFLERVSKRQRYKANCWRDSSARKLQTTDEQKQVKSENSRVFFQVVIRLYTFLSTYLVTNLKIHKLFSWHLYLF